MSTMIAIICTLDELLPYSLGYTANRYFSVHLSVAMRGQPDLPGTMAELFQPWLLTLVTPSVYADSGAAGSPPNGKPVPAPSLAFLDTAAVDCSAIGASLSGRFTMASANSDSTYFLWSDEPGLSTPPTTGENWSRLLAHASTYPAPIPHSLNLAFHFKIDAKYLTTNNITRLFVAPTIIGKTTTYSPGKDPNQPDKNSLVEWDYNVTQAGAFPVAAFQPEYLLLPVKADSAKPHFIDRNSFLVYTSDGTDQTAPQEADASEDWHSVLEFYAGEGFDLGQRIIVALRTLFFPPPPPPPQVTVPPTPPPPTPAPLTATYLQVDQLKTAILAALRDTADAGLRYGPDGTNLIRFMLQRVSGVVVDPVAMEEALIVTAPYTADSWPTFISSTLSNVPTTLSQEKRNQRGADGALASSDYIQATLDMLDSVQKALATDSNLSILIQAQWKAYLSTLPTGTIDAVAKVFSSLPTDRTLRTRMLLANMGGQAQLPPVGANPPQPANPAVPVWMALTTTRTGAGTDYSTEVQDVSTNLGALLPAYFQGRFGIASSDPNAALFANRTPQATWPANNGKPAPDLSTALKNDAASFASSVLFPTALTRPARASHPIMVQVDDSSDPATTLTTDPARKLAGFGLLLREETALWTCANVANLYGPVAAAASIATNVPVPLRISRRNNVKQVILAYNSTALVGQDATDQKSQDFPHEATYPPDDSSAQIFQFRQDALGVVQTASFVNDGTNFTFKIPTYTLPDGKSLGDWMRIPALKFGRTYTFLPFVMGNGGALPPLLASKTDPFTLATPLDFQAAWQNANLKGFLRTATYKRRVAVGAPRLFPLNYTNQQTTTVTLPVFPDTVIPLARDLTAQNQPGTPQSTSQTPILLLWGDPTTKPPAPASSFSFQLRPPACDFDTWDRWVAGLTESAQDQAAGNTYRNTRVAVQTAIDQGTLKSTDATAAVPGQPTPSAPDLTLDDPAVASLTFTLKPIYPVVADPSGKTPPALPKPISLTPIPLNPPPALPSTIVGTNAGGSLPQIVQKLLEPVQSNRFTVNVSIGAAVTMSAPTGTVINITVPAGQLWQLDVQPNLAAVDVSGKFEGPAATPAGPAFSVIVEAATQGLFNPATTKVDPTVLNAFESQIWNSLSVGVDTGGRTVSASFSSWQTATGLPDQARDLIHTIDLRHQDWRWMGRPMRAIPSPDWAAPTPALLDHEPVAGTLNSRMWEIASFATRSDDDCAITSSSINFAASGTSPVTLLSLDLSKDTRALYKRFSVDVHSRYEGLPGFPLNTIRARATNPSDATGYTHWRRAVVPPRIPGNIPKPKVLLVIPLTQPLELNDGLPLSTFLPNLLIIANEPCFSVGGLAEELHAQLDLARDPSYPLNVPLQQANPLPELGPNPILSGKAQQDFNLKFTSGDSSPAQPIGTTFDLGTTAPLFGNTCFLLSPSMLLSSIDPAKPLTLPPDGLQHFQTRISFRRKVKAHAFDPLQTDLLSDPTDPFAVEFQSSFDHCLVAGSTSPVAFNDMTFAIENNAIQLYSGKVQQSLLPGPPASQQLELWVLVMQIIKDATGQEQTYALDMLALNSTTQVQDTTNLGIYVLEVLCTNGNQGKFQGTTTSTVEGVTTTTSGIATAAKMLFGIPGDVNRLATDSTARIQRCSPLVSHQ